MRAKVIKQISAWLPVILWAGIIFKLSSGTVPVTSTVFWKDYVFKKSAHMLFFGLMGILFFRALRINDVELKRALIWSFVFAVLYGASDEIHQSFTQVREARIRDVGYDGIGGAIALFLVYYILPKLPKEIFEIVKKVNLI